MKMQIKENEPYTFNCGGVELAKVLTYYGYIPDASDSMYKIVCPFHTDINPSMIVDITEGKWYCFGCGLSGDAVKFVSLLNDKLSELDSLIEYFKILKSDKVAGLDFSKRKIRKKSSATLYNIAHDYYYGLSATNWIKSEDTDVIETRNYMINRGFTPEILNECGAKFTYNQKYPIVFPMYDNSDFKGWVCRTTDKETEKKRKYLYNEGFSRTNTLVGDYSGYDHVFIVEGYMDKLKFNLYGIKNVVAILGWKISHDQIEKLKNKKYIISALDNDDCGKKGTKYLKTVFPVVYRFHFLKCLKDVGESDAEQFHKMYRKTIDEIKIKQMEEK